MPHAPAPHNVPSESPPVALMECPVAGFQFHGGDGCWSELRRGDALALKREPGNRHDPRAIAVEWRGVRLGYVPREANYAVSQMMDRGARVEGRINGLRAGPDPWQRIMIEVVAYPAKSRVAPAPEPPSETRRLGSHVRRAEPPAAMFARNGPRDAVLRAMGERILEDCIPEIARHLRVPPHAMSCAGRRLLVLWEAVEIFCDDPGTNLGIRMANGVPRMPPPVLTLGLHQPVTSGWTEALLWIVARTCAQHGCRKEDVGKPPFGDWLMRSLDETFRDYVDFEAVRREALDFLAPAPLARSLANRIFASPVTAEQFNWVCGRQQAIALTAVEHPSMLPFLWLVNRSAHAPATDPLTALRQLLVDEGLDPAAWPRLRQWGFAAFDDIPDLFPCSPSVIARYANLLKRLEMAEPPRALFLMMALEVGVRASDDDSLPEFDPSRDWFMRALLRETMRPLLPAERGQLGQELTTSIDWLLDTCPNPDANQRHAGWAWIVAQARAYAHERALAQMLPWKVPLSACSVGHYRVVPLTCAFELEQEAQAMKNCLAGFVDECSEGRMLVFSISDARGKRLACFAATRCETSEPWSFAEAAGKMNSPAGHDLMEVAEVVMGKLSGR